MRIEGNCKYDEALPSATNTRKIIFRVQAPKRQEIFLSLCMMHAVFADKETVCLDCVPMTVYVLVSERKRGEIGWPADSQLSD